MQEIQAAILQICTSRGIDVTGFADASGFKNPSGLDPQEILKDCKSIIVFAKAIPHEYYLDSYKPYTKIAFEYFALLDETSREIARFLDSKGERSFPIGSNRPVVFKDRRFMGIVSLKHAAEKAGIGTIGRNTLLLSRQFGPRLRLGGLLTTAPLDNGSPLQKPVCIKNCTICIDKCPHKALSAEGIDFYRCLTRAHGHPLMFLTGIPKSFPDMKALNNFGAWMYNNFGKKYSYICSECIKSCPLFKIGLRRAQ